MLKLISKWNGRLFQQKKLSVIIRKKSYDVTIIGGGAIGNATAVHLALKGFKNICLIEKDFQYKNNSAMKSAGGIRQQFSEKENILMSIYGAEFIKSVGNNLMVDSTAPDIQFHENGYLFLANESNKHILDENNIKQSECGANWYELLNPNALEKKFPWLNSNSIGLGSYGTHNEGYFDPWLLIHAMKAKAQSLGVEYIEADVVGSKLVSVSKSSSGSYLIDKLITMDKKSNESTITSGVYVNAGGAWSGKLIERISKSISNPHTIHPVPVVGRKRCIFTIQTPTNNAKAIIPPPTTPLVIDPTGVYFRPEGRVGQYIAGVSPSKENDCDSDSDNDLMLVDYHLFDDIIWPVLCERVPAFEQLKVISSWAGFYDYNTLDQNAIIGQHSELRNMILCTGFSGHGLQQCPAAGRAVSELISDGGFTTIDLKRFSFERIIENKPVFETGIV